MSRLLRIMCLHLLKIDFSTCIFITHGRQAFIILIYVVEKITFQFKSLNMWHVSTKDNSSENSCT